MTMASAANARNLARYPVQVDIDGDFALDELCALPEGTPAGRITAKQAIEAKLIATPPPAAVTMSVMSTNDAVLLHSIETGKLFRPPVIERFTALAPAAAMAWLALAAHWIDLSRSSGDLRFFNAACKLTGAVWSRHRHRGGTSGWEGLTAQLGAVARLLDEDTNRLRLRLADRVLIAEPKLLGQEKLRVPKFAGEGRVRIVVLARDGSRNARRLLTAATAGGLPIRALCWYANPNTFPRESNYAQAWYPPASPGSSEPTGVPSGIPATTARSWDEAMAAIRAADADLVLLLGMPVLPNRVLNSAKLAVLNAHNGALPSQRGMDAVGWALLQNQPIICSLHLARPAVDTGEVIAAHPVPVAPSSTLAERVKTTQLRLLLAGAAHIAATGALPDLTPQPVAGTQFYRLHPHLKRLLDTSPYFHFNNTQESA